MNDKNHFVEKDDKAWNFLKKAITFEENLK